MLSGTQNTHLIDFYKSKRDIFQKDQRNLSALLEENNVKYGPWTLSFEMSPAILNARDARLIKFAVEKTIRAAEILTNEIVKTPETWREHFPWNEDFFRLALIDPGYLLNIPCSRFDIFYNNGNLKFVELNTDGCSGMTNADLFHKNFMSTVGARKGLLPSGAKPTYVMPFLQKTLLNCYEEFLTNFPSCGLPKQPVVGILDLPGEETHCEFEAVAKFLKENGVETEIVTPEQAEFDGQKLTFAGKQIHLIYRRLLGVDYAQNMKLLAPVTSAFLKRKVCMVGAPRSQFPFSKKFFAFLQDEKNKDLFDKTDTDIRKAVDEFIPWTRIFRDKPVAFHGKNVNLFDFTRKNKDLFVLKPCESKCGYGIFQGKFLNGAQWDNAIHTAANQDYIIQEFIELPREFFPRFLPNMENELRYIHLGAYCFGGNFSGLLGRTCANPLLTVVHGERLLAVCENRSS